MALMALMAWMTMAAVLMARVTTAAASMAPVTTAGAEKAAGGGSSDGGHAFTYVYPGNGTSPLGGQSPGLREQKFQVS